LKSVGLIITFAPLESVHSTASIFESFFSETTLPGVNFLLNNGLSDTSSLYGSYCFLLNSLNFEITSSFVGTLISAFSGAETKRTTFSSLINFLIKLFTSSILFLGDIFLYF
jgi:hypothetical protein